MAEGTGVEGDTEAGTVSGDLTLEGDVSPVALTAQQHGEVVVDPLKVPEGVAQDRDAVEGNWRKAEPAGVALVEADAEDGTRNL